MSFSNRSLDFLTPPPLKELSSHLAGLVRVHLWAQVLVAMCLGIGIGFMLGPEVGWVDPHTAATVTSWLALPGQLFLALIQMIVIPLVFASIVLGLASGEDLAQLRRLGLSASGFFIVTTALAILVGVGLTFIFEPGLQLGDLALKQLGAEALNVGAGPAGPPSLQELPGKLVGLLPNNPLSSMAEGQMLQVVIFAMVFGGALVILPRGQANPTIQLLASIQAACMTVVRWAMYLAPIAVLGLVSRLASQIGFSALIGMACYVGTVLLGLFILFVIYLVLVFVLGGMAPTRFALQVREVLLLAFSTSSSAAVMPLSIKTAEEKLGVRTSIAHFVIPLGATINMAGTALYQGVATVFLSQVFGVELGSSEIVLIVVMAVGASIGSPATPGVGIVILAMVLDSVGIPRSGIALIMGVDRILDMSRTALNVCGDLVVCRIIERFSSDR